MDFIKDLLAGALAGLTTDSVLIPIDNLKTKLQSKEKLTSCNFNTLYGGSLPTVIGSVPGTAVFFCFYELIKRKLTENKRVCSDSCVYIVSTCGAEAVADLVRTPFEIIKQQMQVSQDSKMTKIIYNMCKKEEVFFFFFRSYCSMLFRDIPASCIQFFLWETFKKKSQQKYKKLYDKFPTVGSALCGSLAGGIAGFLTTPIDVIKSRQVLYGKDFVCTIQDLFNEGLLSFYSGWLARTTYMCLGGTVFLGSFTFFSLALNKLHVNN